MELQVDDLPTGATVARLIGRMDIDGAQAVDQRLSILANTKSALVLDVSGVSFIASMGLRSLMTCARALGAKGGKLAIAGAAPNVLKVLETSGMGQIAPLAATVDDAVAAIAG